MSDPSERRFEADTISFLGALIACALIVPLLALLIVYGYSHFSGVEFTRKEWKNIIAIVWVSTLGVLSFFALRNRRGIDRSSYESNRDVLFDSAGAKTQADKWEYRSSRFILRKVYAATLIVPLIGIAAALGVLSLTGIPIALTDWKMLIVIYWAVSSLTGIYFAFRSRRERLGGR